MKKKMSLVEQAKSMTKVIKHRKLKPGELDLALAWLMDEVTITQIAKVTNTSETNVHSRIAIVIREGYRRGRIKVLVSKE